MSDKTEDPTPRRLRRARAEGDSGVSGYLAQAVAFVGALAVMRSACVALAAHAGDDLRAAIDRAARTGGHPVFDAEDLIASVVALALPALVSASVAGAAAYVVQTGGVVAARRIGFDFSRLDPAAGIARLFSGPRIFAVARALLAGIAVALLAWRCVAGHLADFAHTAAQTGRLGDVISDAAGQLAWRTALLGVALGMVDLAITRRSWWRRLRMTKDEVRREHRESEGDPQVKAARERAYHELLSQATIGTIRSASVVVVNPTHLACALRYDAQGGDDAPVVVATGEGDLAQRIVQAAHQWGIPVVHDVPLARALVELSVGEPIPEALYEAIAEILRDLWAAGGGS